MRKYRCIKSISNENTYAQTVIAEMTKLVEKKLDGIKVMFPILLTIITSILVYLLTNNIPSDALWIGYIIIGYLLLIFSIILMALYPSNYYFASTKNKKKAHKKNTYKFSPWDTRSYIKLSDEEFFSKLEFFCRTPLNKEELLTANILKQKINELCHKKKLLWICCVIIVGGAMILSMVSGGLAIWEVYR